MLTKQSIYLYSLELASTRFQLREGDPFGCSAQYVVRVLSAYCRDRKAFSSSLSVRLDEIVMNSSNMGQESDTKDASSLSPAISIEALFGIVLDKGTCFEQHRRRPERILIRVKKGRRSVAGGNR